jgi:ketosteroid isomerase-like protein
LKKSTPAEVALKFAENINDHDVDSLIALMTPDHTFVDSLGEKFARPMIENGWKQYFAMVPDYRIEVERSVQDGDTVFLIGRARGTFVSEGETAKSENRWETPAVWVARIRGEKVAEWRIYSDNEPIRQKMRRAI